MRSKFTVNILKWCQEHQEDPLSQYFIESYAESDRIRKEEAKRWKLISKELLELEYKKNKMTHGNWKGKDMRFLHGGK